ncbi:MAG TPA: hypothetical protein VGG75_23105 [Trebonia sp.]|jgi:hypothetical protein
MNDSIAWPRYPFHDSRADPFHGLRRNLRRDARQAAASVAALLARNPGPATLLFEELAGEPVRIDLTIIEDRPLTATECQGLEAPAQTRGYKRTGALRTCGGTGTPSVTVAEVYSLVIPSRLPPSARRALGIPGPGDPAPPRSDAPLGKVLAGLGARREPLGARVVPLIEAVPAGEAALADGTAPAARLAFAEGAVTAAGMAPARETVLARETVAVEATARMWLDDIPVALAGELVTANFCQRVHRASPPVTGAGRPAVGNARFPRARTRT